MKREHPTPPIGPYRPAWAVVDCEGKARPTSISLVCGCCGLIARAGRAEQSGTTAAFSIRGWIGLCPSCRAIIFRALANPDPDQIRAALAMLLQAETQAGEVRA